VTRGLLIGFALVLAVPARANADDGPRWEGSLAFGPAFEHRVGVGDPILFAPLSLGLDVRVTTQSREHGALLALTYLPSAGIGLGNGGPILTIVDAAYTMRPRRAEGFSFEVGPSLAWVSRTLAMSRGFEQYEDVPEHITVGGRVSFTFRSSTWKPVFFELAIGYRGGVPLAGDIGFGVPKWEGTPFLSLGVGMQSTDSD
jgi:hypothetical protein